MVEIARTFPAGEVARPSTAGPPSRPYPLGVSGSDEAANVAVYAPGVRELEVHFQPPGAQWQRAALYDYSAGVHSGVVGPLPAGSRYGFRNPSSSDDLLLLDPYGRAIDDDGRRLTSVRTSSGFDWGRDSTLHRPWRDTVIYEAHVKGQTMLHPEIPADLRGTYAGLAHPVMIQHLLDIGVTAVQLLPVHYHLDEEHLRELGLTNYWGYNTIGYFAPHTAYATAAARDRGHQAVQDEFKGMVKLLHAAGLEVILDVVYNHTAESGKECPGLSFRGLGDEQYYRHDSEGNYLDTTGCGNTLNFNEPRVIQLALDSLRYWVEEFHIDGFRFDLAVSMCRDGSHRFSPRHPFLVAAGADPILHGTKLIAEPWDLGPDGWQTGHFPPGWADWNDRFRDTVRDFWIADRGALTAGGTGGSVARLAGALAGSADVFAGSGRSTLASLNFVTAHDGFTLADLVSYNSKHNEANGEDNLDGNNFNRSFNHGVEGQTRNPQILADRAHTARNVLTTLLLSLGVPMLSAGDEIGRTQWGNNNAYCQDNELAWLNWKLDEHAAQMLETTRTLSRLRRQFLLHQPHNYPVASGSSYLLWFNPVGEPMTSDEWTDPASRAVQLLLGSPDGVMDGLMVINGGTEEIKISLPTGQVLQEVGLADAAGCDFELRFTTAADTSSTRTRVRSGESDVVPANAINVYRIG